MQAINFWNKLYLHWCKIIALGVLLLLMSNASFAQRQTAVNNPNYDNRFLSYGFLIGVHTSAYQLKYSERFTSPEFDSLYSISPRWSAGFTLGFLVNLNVADFLDIRMTPQVSFYEHSLDYERTNADLINELVETTVVEFPLLLKYKSERRGNTRMFFVGGLKPGLEASGKNDIDEVSDENIDIKTVNVSFDVGFGIDIYYPLFKFSPELRFSRGITNMLGSENNIFGAGIDRLNTNTITLYLIFQ